MAPVIYTLCMLTALLCTGLLLRAYRRSGNRLLFWSALCFGGLTLNSLVLMVDKHLLTQMDLSTLRLLLALGGVVALIYGLIFESE